jgi:phosphoribosyl 1,2-cyclic phosphodiesterase
VHFATLASGSSGNAILVGEGGRHLLVDAGLPAKQILQNIQKIGLDPCQLEGIFVTHEHIDHLRGVGSLARKCRIPVYATAGLWAVMEADLGPLMAAQKIVVDAEEAFSLAGLKLSLLRSSHDSAESYGLRVESAELALGIATDTGVMTPELQKGLRHCDALIVEANHDLSRLWQGPYPQALKRRITGDRGHLSNIQIGAALRELIGENTQKIVLAHLSEINNTPALALKTVVEMLRSHAIREKCARLKIRVAPRHEPHELVVLAEEERGRRHGLLR